MPFAIFIALCIIIVFLACAFVGDGWDMATFIGGIGIVVGIIIGHWV